VRRQKIDSSEDLTNSDDQLNTNNSNTESTELSEKAKGKLPAIPISASGSSHSLDTNHDSEQSKRRRSSATSSMAGSKFVPTEEWVKYFAEKILIWNISQ